MIHQFFNQYIISAFKIACLTYTSSPLIYEGKEIARSQLINEQIQTLNELKANFYLNVEGKNNSQNENSIFTKSHSIDLPYSSKSRPEFSLTLKGKKKLDRFPIQKKEKDLINKPQSKKSNKIIIE